jgi:hypothetical protein
MPWAGWRIPIAEADGFGAAAGDPAVSKWASTCKRHALRGAAKAVTSGIGQEGKVSSACWHHLRPPAQCQARGASLGTYSGIKSGRLTQKRISDFDI